MIVFLFALLVSAILLFLAGLVIAASKKRPANLWLAAFLACAAGWLPASVTYTLYSDPPESILLLTYKITYTLDLLALSVLLFFGYSLLSEGKPPKAMLFPVFIADAILAAASWSGLLIGGVSMHQTEWRLKLKPLYIVFIIWSAAKFAAFLATLFRLRSTSRGIERSRINVILWGFAAPLTAIFAGFGIYPLITGRDFPGDWMSFTVIVPAAASTYAVLRYRLLDPRLAAQRIVSWLLAVGLVTGPSLGLILLLRWAAGPESVEAQAHLALSLLVLTVLLAPLIYRLTDRAATLFLFAGLYRPEDLLDRITRQLDDTIEAGRGLRSALETACREMGLEKLLFVLPGEGGDARLLGCRYDRVSGYVQVDEAAPPEGELRLPHATPLLLGEESVKGPGGSVREPWEEMERKGVCALLPSISPSGWMGNLLAGCRMGGARLRAVDLDFLEQLAGALAIFAETRTLSTRLIRRLEVLRSSARELAGKMRLRRDAAVIVSHELRTPLTSVVGFSHLLKESYDKLDRWTVAECVDSVEENVSRLERIMSTLEEVSRLREGRVVLRMETVGLEEIFLRVRLLLNPVENGRVDYRLPEESALTITDPYLVLLILRNLLSNALRFSPPESKVVLEASTAADRAEFRVIDRGPGIRPELLKEVFQPFTRLEDVDKHQAGTGLGLYAARMAAEMLGTSIEVLTEPGKGSTFYFALPRAQGHRD